MGVSTGSQAELSILAKRSNVYFHCERKSPCLDRDTSIPTKYFSILEPPGASFQILLPDNSEASLFL